MSFNGFVQSADRFAVVLTRRFADRFDDLYGFEMFFNGIL